MSGVLIGQNTTLKIAGGAVLSASSITSISFSTSSTQYALLASWSAPSTDTLTIGAVQLAVSSGTTTVYSGGYVVPPSTTVTINVNAAGSRHLIYTLLTNSP